MKRRCMQLLALSLVGFITLLYYVSNDRHGYLSNFPSNFHGQYVRSVYSIDDEWDPSRWLQGNKTNLLQDNLKKDVFYITSGACSGFTNLFIGYVNMLYLASITDRVPIIPPFSPGDHVSSQNPSIPFGEVFDLPRLRSTLRMPILEWHDVKTLLPGKHVSPLHDVPQSEPEAIGCWSSWWKSDAPAKLCLREDILNLDISYTRVDDRYRRESGEVSLFPLASTIYPNTPPPALPIWTKSGRAEHSLAPDQHLACFDDLYFTITNEQDPWELWGDFNPKWRSVGQHVHFTPKMVSIATQYVRQTLGLSPRETIPPFISVHVRHGDFAHGVCTEEQLTNKGCFTSISQYAELVSEVQKELREIQGIEVQRVILASDEKDPVFWNTVQELGWSYVNHTAAETSNKYGSDWYEVFLDTVMLSMGAGIVGTRGSTLSLLASKRIRDWHGGIARMVNSSPHRDW